MIDVLRSALDGMSTFVYTSDLETGTLLFVNKRMRETFGIDGDVSGIACREAMQRVGGGIRCASCPVSALKERPDSPVVWEERDVLTGHWYKSTDSVIDWFDGKKAHLGAFIDITALRQAEMDLRQSHQALKNILNSLDACVFVSDLDTDEILFANRKTTEMFLPDGDMTGRTCWETMQKGMAGRCPFCRKEQLRAVPGAAVMWEEHNALVGGHCYKNIDSVIDWINGKKAHMQYSIDITRYDALSKELLTAKEAAERANQTKSQFLSKVSHEIRTPMNAIIGMTEILLGEEQGARQRSYLSDIKISATALLGIINDILDFSKLDAGKMELHEEHFSLKATIEFVTDMFRNRIEQKHLGFTLDYIDLEHDDVITDPLRLNQILINLLSNAIKFTDEGEIKLTVEEVLHSQGESVFRFTVSDTGIGIDPEQTPKLFTSFTQVSSDAGRLFAGTGLGLSIAKSLVELFGGEIELETTPDKGSTFSFTIRAKVKGNANRSDGRITDPAMLNLRDTHILVVDDIKINREIVDALLEGSGAIIEEAGDGKQALEMFESSPLGYYKIIFMDIMMPIMDGYTSTEHIRALERTDAETVIIIAITANALQEDMQHAAEIGMNGYIIKPIDAEELYGKISRWL
ncbi:MAG TPA: hypothetical protein DEB24_02610 [Coriobacteriia bacterium]|nr:hypothetical protein [Coriobacteriia bacterium]